MLCFGNGAEALAWGIMFVVMPLGQGVRELGTSTATSVLPSHLKRCPRLVSGGAAERTATAGQIE
jgi:hypothetical protein